MFNISIDPTLETASDNLICLGVITADVTVIIPPILPLWDKINRHIEDIKQHGIGTDCTDLAEIAALRRTYQHLHKNPNQFRGSNEALLRRVTTEGKGLYQINNIVDINNYLSLLSKHPVGSYDLSKLFGPIEFRVGKIGESYSGINKRSLNLEGLPVFADVQSVFGSTTSDSKRALILPDTKRIMMVIISFNGPEKLDEYLALARDLLCAYAQAQNITTNIV